MVTAEVELELEGCCLYLPVLMDEMDGRSWLWFELAGRTRLHESTEDDTQVPTRTYDEELHLTNWFVCDAFARGVEDT